MTPPDSTAKVRRYTITHQEYDPMWASRAYAVVPADDHDAALAERDARIAELRAMLESALPVLDEAGDALNKFNRYQADKCWPLATRIRALLATTHNHGGVS